jgi:hypothetical protein
MPGRTSLTAVKRLPWALALDAAVVVKAHWENLKESERSRVSELILKSKGNPRNLTKRERDELRRIGAKLDVPGMARDLVPFARRVRKR